MVGRNTRGAGPGPGDAKGERPEGPPEAKGVPGVSAPPTLKLPAELAAGTDLMIPCPLTRVLRQRRPGQARAEGGRSRSGPAGRGGPPKIGPAGVETNVVAVEEPPYLLFRFFNVLVEPGKRYCYRVKFQLANPNHDQPPQFLERDDLRIPLYLTTEWSVPSEPVTVPLDARVLAAPPEPKEPAGKAGLLAVHFDASTGMEAFHKVAEDRGKWLSYVNQQFLPAPMATSRAVGPLAEADRRTSWEYRRPPAPAA